MSVQSELLRLAAEIEKTAGNIYEELPLNVTGIEDAVEREVARLNRQMSDAGRRKTQIERAWDHKDIDALVEMGVISSHDRSLLHAAYEAQQSGDEDTMYEELERVA